MRIALFALLALLLAAVQPLLAQPVFYGASGMVAHSLESGARVSGLLVVGREESVVSNNALHLSLAYFQPISPTAEIAVTGSAAVADYDGMPNRDAILSLSEAIQWRRTRGISFGFFLEQRILFYTPSDNSAITSCAGGTVAYSHLWEKAKIQADAGAKVFVNMRSETSDAGFLQRVRLFTSARRQISEKVWMGMAVAYHVGGKEQVYLSDRHNMWRLTLSCNFAI